MACSCAGCSCVAARICFHFVAPSNNTSTAVAEAGCVVAQRKSSTMLSFPMQHNAQQNPENVDIAEIGRASCRERVCSVRVDLGGRRIIKTQKNIPTKADSRDETIQNEQQLKRDRP